MRAAAQAEFDKDCDLPTVTLKVDFTNCAETEEYRQYGFLQNIFLGDSVRVIARRIGVEVSMRMTQYTYRNSEGYSDPTAYFALRNALKKPKHEREKPRCPRTQVVHYD